MDGKRSAEGGNFKENLWSVDKKKAGNRSTNLVRKRPEILLDIPQTFTYHTRACAKGLTAQAVEIFRGRWVKPRS
jgi:hypothetical protein